MIRGPPRSALFPYPTLFRSVVVVQTLTTVLLLQTHSIRSGPPQVPSGFRGRSGGQAAWQMPLCPVYPAAQHLSPRNVAGPVVPASTQCKYTAECNAAAGSGL